MAVFIFDSSALVKLYVAETGSVWTRHLVLGRDADGVLTNQTVIANITTVEAIAALVRRARGAVTTFNLPVVLALVERDIDEVFLAVALSQQHIDRARQLAQRHALRGYDAVQLAVAVTINEGRHRNGLSPVTFVTADTELLAAAQAEGLPVDDPNLHP